LLPKDIDPRTQAVREKLKEAMYKHYYKRYHPVDAYCSNSKRLEAQRKDFRPCIAAAASETSYFIVLYLY